MFRVVTLPPTTRHMVSLANNMQNALVFDIKRENKHMAEKICEIANNAAQDLKRDDPTANDYKKWNKAREAVIASGEISKEFVSQKNPFALMQTFMGKLDTGEKDKNGEMIVELNAYHEAFRRSFEFSKKLAVEFSLPIFLVANNRNPINIIPEVLKEIFPNLGREIFASLQKNPWRYTLSENPLVILNEVLLDRVDGTQKGIYLFAFSPFDQSVERMEQVQNHDNPLIYLPWTYKMSLPAGDVDEGDLEKFRKKFPDSEII